MAATTWQFVEFTLRMAGLAMLLILVPGTLTAWLLARFEWRGKALVETFVSLPLVMPPVVTGLLLLQLFGRNGPLGSLLLEWLGIEVAFTWRAVVMALGVMSFPLLVRSVRSSIEATDPVYEQMARSLGAGRWRVFCTVTLPLARRGILAGMLLSFARALGDFGATVMVAGSIPGSTMTLSIGIYQMIQLGQDQQAWWLAACSASIAFAAVFAAEMCKPRQRS